MVDGSGRSRENVKRIAKKMIIEMNFIIAIALIVFAIDAMDGSIDFLGVAALVLVPAAPVIVLYRFYRRLRLLSKR